MKKYKKQTKDGCVFYLGYHMRAESQGEGTGSALHIYNEEGKKFLHIPQGVGWYEKERQKQKQSVHSALKISIL